MLNFIIQHFVENVLLKQKYNDCFIEINYLFEKFDFPVKPHVQR